MKNLFEIEIKDGVYLVAERSQKPFDKEIGIYLKSNGIFQDIALISPNYELDDDLNVHYDDKEIIVRLWEDEDSDDYTKTVNIPFEEKFNLKKKHVINKKIFEIEIKDGVFLVVEQNSDPFDKEFVIYLLSNGTFQNIALVSPDYTVDEYSDVYYFDSEILVSIWENQDTKDYTKTIIPFRKEIK